MATNPAFHAPALRFEVETEAIVHCTGRITSSTTELLRAMIKPLIEENRTVVLDLSAVAYMDSAGLGTIIALYVSARAAHCQLKLVNLSQRVQELLTITRLLEVLTRGGHTPPKAP